MTTHHTSGAADLPEALRLAEWMQNAVVTYPQMSEDEPGGYCQEIDQVMDQAAAELRRLHNESVEAHAGYRTEQYWLGWNAALAAGQAVAQPVRTWCDGCSLENCGGCHIPSNAAAPAQAPSQLGGFSAGDMASAAAQGFRDGLAAAQAISAEPAATQPAPQADSVLEDAARYRWLADYLVGDLTDLDDEIVACKSVYDLSKVVDAARKQGANHD